RQPGLRLRRELHRRRPRPAPAHRRRAGRAAHRRRRRRPACRGAGPLMEWFLANTGLVAELAVQHARLSVVPIVLGLVLALPPGVLAWRRRSVRGPLLAAVGLLYTIPSLALFVLIPPIIGISFLSELNV